MPKKPVSRPKNLDKLVFFDHVSNLSSGEILAGGNAKYIEQIRRKNRPVIYLHELNNRKYKWEVGFDLVEGFNTAYVKLTPASSNYVYRVLIEPKSVQKEQSSCGDINSFGNGRYSCLEDAVAVANKLASLPESAFIFPAESHLTSRLKVPVKPKKFQNIVWSEEIKTNSLASWMNDWIIQETESVVKIGSNSKEWSGKEDYDPTRSSLYGSYGLYCQEFNFVMVSIQKFSSLLLELNDAVLHWQLKKTRVEIKGVTTRVIKGIRLRTKSDNLPTIKEMNEPEPKLT